MKLVATICGTAAALCFANIAQAQTAVLQPAPAAVPMAVAPANVLVLRAGTPLAVKTSENLTTEGKKLRVGQRLQLETAEPLRLNDQIVIPAGSPVTGEITDVRNKGMWGKSGRINARVLFVRANGRQIRLTGNYDDKGVTGTAGVVASIALVPIAGFFVTGTSAKIPMGSPVNAFVDEDVSVAFAAPVEQAPVMVVPQTAPAPTLTPAVVTKPTT